jgi:hypothetical protein
LVVLFDGKIPRLEERFGNGLDVLNVGVCDAVTGENDPVVIIHVAVDFDHTGWRWLDTFLPLIQIHLNLLVLALVAAAMFVRWEPLREAPVSFFERVFELSPSGLFE